MDHNNSIADKSGEFWGHLAIIFPLIEDPLSQVGINLSPKSLLISF